MDQASRGEGGNLARSRYATYWLSVSDWLIDDIVEISSGKSSRLEEERLQIGSD